MSRIPLNLYHKLILDGISDGRTIVTIARRNNIALDTLKTHARQLYEVLGVHTQAAAVRAAIELDVLQTRTFDEAVAYWQPPVVLAERNTP